MFLVIISIILGAYLSGAIGSYIGYRESEACKSYPESLWPVVIFWPWALMFVLSNRKSR